MNPSFPHFKKLEISDISLIEKFTKQFPPYNDFDTIDLLIFNPNDDTSFSILNNNLVVRRQHYMSDNYLFTFLGINHTKDTILKLIEKSKEENLGTQLVHIPEVDVKPYSELQEYFLIEEDPDNFDYILSINELSDLKGSKYYDKRNLVNRFKKLHPDYIVKTLDLNNKKIQNEICDLFFLWEKQKGRNRKDTEIELSAVRKLFNLIDILHIYGLGVYDKDKLIGFTTYHALTNNYAAISLEKGDISYQGIYPFLNHETAKCLKKLGFTYLNFEQDLGIPGLKKAKKLWRPIFFLKKYTISKK